MSARARREIPVADAVRWYDGMPLAPQHFQESFRRLERLLDYHLDVLAPYHYGVASLDIDAASLSGGVLSVKVEAVLPDRLLVRAARALTMRLDPAELRKVAARPGQRKRTATLDVYLAVPNEHPGRAAAGDAPRYLLPGEGDRITDDTTGESDLEVHRLVPNVQIVVDVEPPPDASWIRLAQLRLDGDAFSRAEYVPPLLVVAPGSALFALCARVVETIRSLSNRLGERIAVLSENTDAALIAETRRQLYHLTAALPPFETMLVTERAHPYPLYVALAGIMGQLAPLARTPVPAPLPVYQHDDLYAIFAEVEARLQRIIREGIQQSFKPHPFELEGDAFRLDFTSDWADRPVLLAVRERRGAEGGESLKWMEGAIVGPLRLARELQASRALGVGRDRVARMDDLVPTSDEVLFELKDLKAFIRADEPIVVYNPAKDSGETRPVEVVLYVKELKP